jgi:hypothetical protein
LKLVCRLKRCKTRKNDKGAKAEPLLSEKGSAL